MAERKITYGDISIIQHEVGSWADEVHPNRTPEEALRKLLEHEIPEIIAKPDDPKEYADAVILILDIGYLRGFDVLTAVMNKMEINRRRAWKIGSDGLLQHTEES